MSIGIIFIIMAVLLALSAPIAVCIAVAALLPSFFDPSFMGNSGYVFRTIVTSMDSTPFLAVPLFILSGNIMARGGISDKLFRFFSYFLGNKTGGLPAAVVVTCLFYGAITGSAMATVAAVGAMTIPFLTNLGYELEYATALVAISGGLGVIIPPSIPFIMYAMAASESVKDLFTAGIIPGIVIAVFLIGYAVYYCYKHGEDKEKLHKNYEELHSQSFWAVFKDSFWALLTPVIILGGIYSGIVTPTEAADISVVYALIVSIFIYKNLSIKDLPKILIDSATSAVPALFVAGAAVAFGRVMAMLQIPQMVASFITSTFSSKVALLLVINVFLLIVGMLMETNAAILILTPILLPVMTAFGMDPIHFGIMMTVNLAIGFVTPPVGVNLFVASSMTGVPVMTIAKKAIPFMVMFLLALLVITFVPQLSLILVR